MFGVAVITILTLARLIVPFGVLLYLGTWLNKRQEAAL